MLLYHVIIFAPLIGALIAGTAGTKFGRNILNEKLCMVLTTSILFTSAALSWVSLVKVGINHEAVDIKVLRWIDVGNFKADWAFKIDTLTAVMLVVVNSVSALVHLYSWGYMSDDNYKPRFFSYLSLFTFAMLMLVTSNNFIQLFFGWEGVGLASYLLIGYYFKKDTANAASIKAFVTNRVGDVGLALGVMTVFLVFGSVNFDTVFSSILENSDRKLSFLSFEINALELIAALLFIGAMGKSAQFLLHVWLPDAMEGPTPVSALIHAATMVTAGVFLICRASAIYDAAPITSGFITAIGAFTAFFAASVALVQNDIKRVIAYSTCSQLGYMFFAAGVGAYNAAMFHLFTHAFFKALLFLCAGSVIHAMHHEQDMRKMGGIWKKVPFTYIAMIIGTLAITGIGIPGTKIGFAGFFSKDAIIEAAYTAGAIGASNSATFAFWIGIIAAFMTAFYSWRLIFMTFNGNYRGDQKTYDNAHESPLNMLVPLGLLSVGAIIAGVLFYSKFMGNYGDFWNGSLVIDHSDHHASMSIENLYAAAEVSVLNGVEATKHSGIFGWMFNLVHGYPFWVLLLPLLVSISGFSLAFLMYMRGVGASKHISDIEDNGGSPLYNFLLNKWYIDEIYEIIFIKWVRKMGDIFWKIGDQKIIDGFGPNGISSAVSRTSKRLSKLQSGYLYHYAFFMFLGVALIVIMVFSKVGG